MQARQEFPLLRQVVLDCIDARALAVLSLSLFLAYVQEPFRPADRDKQQIQSKLKALTAAVNSLRADKTDDDLLVEIDALAVGTGGCHLILPLARRRSETPE